MLTRACCYATMVNCQLPAWELEEIVGCILQWLPPIALLRARLVCRTWNRVVLFQRSRVTNPCYSHNDDSEDEDEYNGGRLFDSSYSSWTRVSCPTPSSPLMEAWLLGSGGNPGLVASCERPRFNHHDNHDDHPWLGRKDPPLQFWVGNPLINKWKFIPGCPELVYLDNVPLPMCCLHLLVSEGPPVSYKIVALADLRAQLSGVKAIIYSSVTKEWRLGASSASLVNWTIAGAVTHNGLIYFVSHQPLNGRSQIVAYSLEHDRFDVIAEAVAKDITPEGIHLVEGSQVPVLLVYRERSRLLPPTFHEFQKNEHGWDLKETSRHDALKEGLPVLTMDECVLRFSGNAEYTYAFLDYLDSRPAAMFEFDSHAGRFRPRPFRLNQEEQVEDFGLNRICSFIPQFDIHP